MWIYVKHLRVKDSCFAFSCFFSHLFDNLCTEAGILLRCSLEKVFFTISQNSQENTLTRTLACNFITRNTPTQVFSYKFCKIFRNVFFSEHLRVIFFVCIFFIYRKIPYGETWCTDLVLHILSVIFKTFYLEKVNLKKIWIRTF